MSTNRIDSYISNSTMSAAERSIIMFTEGAARVALNKAGELVTTSVIDWFSKPAVLSREDMQRHTDLVNVYYKSFGRTEKIPSFWNLSTDNRPTFVLNYDKEIVKTQSCIDDLIAKKSGMYLARAGILSLLIRYLQSMRKRSKAFKRVDVGSIRDDGIELMFILEMLTWFRDVLPELDQMDSEPDKISISMESKRHSFAEEKMGMDGMHSQVSEGIVSTDTDNLHESRSLNDVQHETSSTSGLQGVLQNRIKYCEDLLAKIAINHNFFAGYSLDSSRANFKDLLSRLTEQFKSYRMYLIQKSAVMRFNELINNLGDQLSELSALSFHVLHLLIKDVNQPYLIVEQFLSPYKSDVKVAALKKTRIGVWIERTLELAGIKDSTFESNRKITLATIKSHLEGELPSDENCHLTGNLRDPLSNEWGHWDFVLKSIPDNSIHDEFKLSKRQELEIQSISYLEQMRKFCRLILLIYFIRQNMVRAATVASVFGEVWIYGDRIGKVVLDELLSSISDVIEDYSDEFETFWKGYFGDFWSYAEQNRTNDKSNPCFQWLKIHVDLKYKPKIEKLINNIFRQIGYIREHSGTLPRIKEETKKIQKALYQDLLDFMIFKNKKSSTNYLVIKNALNDLDFEQACETAPSQELSTIITFPLAPNPSLDMRLKSQKKRATLGFKHRSGSFQLPGKSFADEDRHKYALTSPVNYAPLWGNHVYLPGRMHWVDGDGNCFFRAVALELNRQSGWQLTYQMIRNRGVEYLRENIQLLNSFISENQTPDEYLDVMSTSGSWAEGPIIDAVARSFNIHLCIMDVVEDEENGVKLFPIHINDVAKSKCTVGLVRQNLHYNALELQGNSSQARSVAKQMLPITNGQTVGREAATCDIALAPGTSEASIKCRSFDLTVFESISLLLGAYVITDRSLAKKMNDSLLQRPEKFYSDMQKCIYEEFLVKHSRIKNTRHWLLSIRYRLSQDKIDKLIKLYNKVNACFLVIYDNTNSERTLSKLEKTLIDERLYRIITKEFSDNKFFQFNIPAPEPALTIARDGDSYEVIIDSFRIPEIKDKVLEAADEQILSRSEDREKISELKQKLYDTEEKLAVKDVVISQLEFKVEARNQLILELRKQLNRQFGESAKVPHKRERQVELSSVGRHAYTMYGGIADATVDNHYEKIETNSM